MERGAIMIVNQWPTHINVEGGIICNPTPEQCRQAGFELFVPPTAEEIAEQERIEAERLAEIERIKAENAVCESDRLAKVEILRDNYRSLVARFCQVAGIETVTKFEDETVIMREIEKANGEQNITKSLGLTQLSIGIKNAIDELRRKDGFDAWEKI